MLPQLVTDARLTHWRQMDNRSTNFTYQQSRCPTHALGSGQSVATVARVLALARFGAGACTELEGLQCVSVSVCAIFHLEKPLDLPCIVREGRSQS